MPDYKNKNIEEMPMDTPQKEDKRLTPRGMDSVQGNKEKGDQLAHEQSNTRFVDSEGRDLTMSTFHSGDNYYIRVYDDSKTPRPPDHPTFGDAGRANLRLERNEQGDVDRAKIQEIETIPKYQGAGIGGQMLNECEEVAQNQKANEIYGIAPEAETTREWYKRRGYQYREGGKEVYKSF
jgi:ribosomal protein S18 acetylase RimI-like enzyme